MKSTSSSEEKGFVRWPLPLLIALGMLLPLVAWAAPAWWTNQGVLNTNTPQDYNAVNLGQLKNMAAAATAELNADLPSTNGLGAGLPLNNMVASWYTPASNTEDYNAVNLGQLKNIAKPFYDRLISVQYTNNYPWISTPAGATNDYAMANIGQMKYLFSFDLSAPAGQIPAWWANYYGITNASAPANRGDGLSNLQAYQLGLNPNDYYNGLTPILTILSGDNQSVSPISPGPVSAAPLVVQVNDIDGVPLTNAPVTFSASSTGQISPTNSGTFSSSLALRTDTNGQIQLFAEMPTPATNFTVAATAGAVGTQAQVSFTVIPILNPSAITGLGLWFRADTGVTYPYPVYPGNNVAGWKDMMLTTSVLQSASANQPTLAYKSINGKSLPVLRFNGHQWLDNGVTFGSNFNNEMTMIVVGSSSELTPLIRPELG